ncbi:MAG: hypothetical protein NZ519_01865 [Bacteroidia bacterium]|nr:hypothetical protein [Bacteroidia bacterium]MDW8300860.1 hypothetical protein [Bacteroidia bacterium]
MIQFLQSQVNEDISQELIEKIQQAAQQKLILEKEIENLRIQIDEILEDLQYSIDRECQYWVCEHFDIHHDEYSLLKQIFNNQEREYELALQEGKTSVSFFMISDDEVIRWQIQNLEGKGYLTTYQDIDNRVYVRLQANFFTQFKSTLESIENRIRNLEIYRNLFRESLNEI